MIAYQIQLRRRGARAIHHQHIAATSEADALRVLRSLATADHVEIVSILPRAALRVDS